MIVFSHGFGVLKDSRGLFTAIAESLEGETLLFDYNSFDDEQNIITVTPIDQQVEKLKTLIAEAHQPIDLIAHSQGCIIAALAQPAVRQAIFLAPGTSTTAQKLQAVFAERPRTHIDPTAVSILESRNGTITHIHPDYWQSFDGIGKAEDIYRKFARSTDLTIITAELDEKVRHKTNFQELSDVAQIKTVAGADHNFRDQSRGAVIKAIHEVLTRS